MSLYVDGSPGKNDQNGDRNLVRIGGWTNPFPDGSMYGIFTFIYPQNYPNVGK